MTEPLHKSLYYSLINLLRDIIIVLDADHNILDLNNVAANTLFDSDKSALMFQSISTLSKDLNLNLNAVLEHLTDYAKISRIPQHIPYIHPQTNKAYSFLVQKINNRKSPVYILVGQPDELEDYKNFKVYIDTVINSLPGSVYWKDKEGHYLGCNKVVAEMAGFTDRSEVVGKTDFELCWKEFAQEWRDVDNEVIHTGRKVVREEKARLATGEVITELTVKTPLKNAKNEIIGLIGTSLDITDKKQLEEHLINAKKKAEAASKAKTEFLQNMRHDIRTPLSGISGFAELIKHEAKDSNIAEYADNLNASCAALQDFLNSILEAIRVLSGDVPLIKKKFLLREYINNVVDLNRAAAADKKLTLAVHIDDNLPDIVIGDPKRLHRILLELITNAIKFTEQGTIKLTALLSETSERRVIVTFTIKDDGKGLSDAQKDEIFTRFKRLTPAYQGLYKGLGMGLTMVKQFVDELDGEIYVDSSPEEGTLFTINIPFSLPLTHDHDHVEHIKADYSLPEKTSVVDAMSQEAGSLKVSGPKVLFVEDNPLAAKVGGAILKGIDCQVDIANDGTTALGKQQTQHYDIILMDVGLPDLDGCEVTQRIRQSELTTDQHIPIIALTAHIDKENKQRCIEYGMDAVLSKPLAREKALDILDCFLPRFTEKVSTEETEFIIDAVEKLPEKTIDLEAATQVVGDASLAKNMLDMLVDTLPDELSSLQRAHDQDDWQGIKYHTHRLLGGTTYCGVPRLTMICQQLESCLEENAIDKQESLYQQLLVEVTRLMDEYKKLS